MLQSKPIDALQAQSQDAGLLGWAGVTAFAICLYFTVFLITDTVATPINLFIAAICNAVPQVLLAIPLVDRLAPRLAGRKLGAALPVGAAAITLYALVAYCSVIFLLALTQQISTEGIIVRFFRGQALPWQMFQGMAYGSIALMAGLWIDARVRLKRLEQRPSREATPPLRWLVKTQDGIVPVDPLEIVRIEAAGEYSLLSLPGSVIMSRIGMGECEQRLSGLPFLRVHRSHLVNSDAITRAEPAGNGRLQLNLNNGDQIVTSRDGARLVRANAV